MKEAAFWKFIKDQLAQQFSVALLAVVQSEGSSPGRAGFKMAVSTCGQMHGSIGGGIMEHKLVELARLKLQENAPVPILKKQIHSKRAPQNQSGMICSGEQTVAFYFLKPNQLPVIETILKSIERQQMGELLLKNTGISFSEQKSKDQHFSFFFKNDTVWEYAESLPHREKIYIIGAGHVSLALSKMMNYLNFEVRLFDDRPDLNTFVSNDFTAEKSIVNYSEIDSYIPEGEESYVVVMTVGYRTDKIVLQQLLDRNFKYLGLMGSEAKVNKMFAEFREEGVSEAALAKIFAPIGIPVKSKTPEEIAISIAAQIIQIKNA